MKHHSSIKTLPTENYRNIIESGDKRYLLVLDSYDELPTLTAEQKAIINNAWESIEEQIIDISGISAQHQTLLQFQQDIAICRIDILTGGDMSLVTVYNELQRQMMSHIEAMESTDVTFDDQVSILEKHYGFHFDLKTLPLSRWLSRNKILNEQMKRINDGKESAK